MRVIWKYAVPHLGHFDVEMPAVGEVLTVQLQDGEPQMWALVDSGAPKIQRHFFAIGTGHSLSDDLPRLKYIGTWQQSAGVFVWHLFEVLK